MPERPEPAGTVLAFDYGLRKIGVAIGQGLTRTARPLEVITSAGNAALERVAQLVASWKPDAIVIGLPLDSGGEETSMSRAARGFGEEIQARFGLPVHFQDERLSSSAAAAEFARRRSAGLARRKDAKLMDAVAAEIILENWLQSRP